VRLIAVAIVAALMAACGGGDAGPGTTGPMLLSITVTPAQPRVAKGLTQQFTATGTYSDTSTANLTMHVQWSSNTPAVLSLNANSGLASAMGEGSAIVTAKSGSVSGSTTLTVTPGAVESISITPNPAFSGIGLTRQLTATGTYSDGTTANVTNLALWTSSTPSVASAEPTTGLTTGISLGSTTISATMGSVSATTSLTITANSWSPTGNMQSARADHTATLLSNGKVLVVGGCGGAGPSDTAELYDPVSGTWSGTGGFPSSIGNGDHTATLLPNGQVLVTGDPYPMVLLSAELYDPASGTWSATGELPEPRHSHTATLLPDGKVLVVGGLVVSARPPTSELYDPATGNWSPTGNPSTSRAQHTATLLPNGKVLVTGGDVVLAGGAFATQASAELYDPATGTWTSAGNLVTPGLRYQHTATLLPNGMVLVAGGTTSVSTPLASAELYDPASNTWSATATLSTPRTTHTATLLPNGMVLVAGGISTQATITHTAELYDPAAKKWSPTGSLATERYEHTATVLPDGVGLVCG